MIIIFTVATTIEVLLHHCLHSRAVGIETATCSTSIPSTRRFFGSCIGVDSCSNHQSLKPTCLARAQRKSLMSCSLASLEPAQLIRIKVGSTKDIVVTRSLFSTADTGSFYASTLRGGSFFSTICTRVDYKSSSFLKHNVGPLAKSESGRWFGSKSLVARDTC